MRYGAMRAVNRPIGWTPMKRAFARAVIDQMTADTPACKLNMPPTAPIECRSKLGLSWRRRLTERRRTV